jgi:hypothetical protein
MQDQDQEQSNSKSRARARARARAGWRIGDGIKLGNHVTVAGISFLEGRNQKNDQCNIFLIPTRRVVLGGHKVWNPKEFSASNLRFVLI